MKQFIISRLLQIVSTRIRYNIIIPMITVDLVSFLFNALYTRATKELSILGTTGYYLLLCQIMRRSDASVIYNLVLLMHESRTLSWQQCFDDFGCSILMSMATYTALFITSHCLYDTTWTVLTSLVLKQLGPIWHRWITSLYF